MIFQLHITMSQMMIMFTYIIGLLLVSAFWTSRIGKAIWTIVMFINSLKLINVFFCSVKENNFLTSSIFGVKN